MSTEMQPEPEGCPGVGTENAGKTSACAGCPNQSLCSTNQSAANEDRERVVNKIKNIKNKYLILSGKGGVGKSTVTTLLSKYLAEKHEDLNFGVLDIDICGPSQPRMLGVENEQVHNSGSGWSPVNVDDNLCLMSIGFLLSSPDDAIIWRGPKKNGMIKQFLTEVDWGNLDYLLLDTPPGTSDEHLSSVSYLNEPKESLKAIIVTTPQEVALIDVRKQINFCKKLNIPIIGVIENMSPFICGHCNGVSKIFDESSGGAELMYIIIYVFKQNCTKLCNTMNGKIESKVEDCLECRMVGGVCMSLIGTYLWYQARKRKGLERNIIVILSCGTFALGFARIFGVIPSFSKKASNE